MKRILLIMFLFSTLLSGCDTGKGQDEEKPRLSMFVGVDISGSFMRGSYYDDALNFLAHYIYSHLNGYGGLDIPNVLFVGSIGGATADQPKTFYPKQTFENKSIHEIAQKLREIFPKSVENQFTDYNAFFEQIALTVKNKKLVLRPISIVMISDGIPDLKKEGNADFRAIKLKPLEGLARNITLRLLYTNAEVGKNWQTKIRRSRVKIWTQDAEVMVLWRDPKIFVPGKPTDQQVAFFNWLKDNVNFGVSSRRVD